MTSTALARRARECPDLRLILILPGAPETVAFKQSPALEGRYGDFLQARCIRSARREESGKVTLSLAGRPETLTASRLYAHLFKGM